MVASGQMGFKPHVSIWTTTVSSESSSEAARAHRELTRIGGDFFERAVNAVCFSYDNKYLAAVGCDDHHSLGIFEVQTGNLICEAAAHNGTPPQIRAIRWCPVPQDSGFISRDHIGDCDLIVTAGSRHLKYWSFRRPTSFKSAGTNGPMGGAPLSKKEAALAALASLRSKAAVLGAGAVSTLRTNKISKVIR